MKIETRYLFRVTDNDSGENHYLEICSDMELFTSLQSITCGEDGFTVAAFTPQGYKDVGHYTCGLDLPIFAQEVFAIGKDLAV